MRRIRVIPTLLIDRDQRLVKTVKFGKRTYIGDPINAVKIFNKKEVDELVLLDIDASSGRQKPRISAIQKIVEEAFMPVAYGGGIVDHKDIEELFKIGLEKVILSTAVLSEPHLVEEAAKRFGSQSIAVCLPYKNNLLGKTKVFVKSGKKTQSWTCCRRPR